MRCVYILSFLIVSLSLNARSLTRGVRLEFKNNCTYLSSENKNIIVDEYLKIGEGDWLYFNTVSIKEISENRLLAFKNSKIRNRAIGAFLKQNGIKQKQLKYKYASFEHIWVNKPVHLESSVDLKQLDDERNVVSHQFRNIDGYSFVLNSGNIIAFKSMNFEGSSSDLITVKIKEFNSKLDFVKYGVTAQGDKGMLETQGMYLVEAFSNGSKVNLRRNTTYELKIKDGKSDQPFYSFYGKESKGRLTWSKNGSQKFYSTKLDEPNQNNSSNEGASNIEGAGKFGDFYVDEFGNLQALEEVYETSEVSNALGDYLIGKFSGLGWINCDRFYQEEETITMQLKIDAGVSDKAFSVYVIFKDINSVLPVYQVTNGTYQTPEIPKGAKATVFAVQANGKQGNKLAFKDITTSNAEITTLNSNEVSEQQVEKYMKDIIY